MLIKRKSTEASRGRLQAIAAGYGSGTVDRRTFLRRSGLTVGGLAAVGSIGLGSVRKAEAIPGPKPGAIAASRKRPFVIPRNRT